jgi:hypothetical protein
MRLPEVPAFSTLAEKRSSDSASRSMDSWPMAFAAIFES